MLVPITTKAAPWRAHLDRALLAEHGISAWVWGDAGGCLWGDTTLGGCSLAVEADSLEEAKRILAAKPAAVPSEAEGPPVAPLDNAQPDLATCTLLGALGGAGLAGAWQLAPVLVALLTGNVVETVGALPGMLWRVLIAAVCGLLTGILAGLLFGVGAWLLRDWRHRGPVGAIFVVGLVMAYTLGNLIVGAIAVLVRALAAFG
jgi:hypothetical protein